MQGKSSGYVKVGAQQLHYLRMGEGKKLLLAFHGYHNDAGLFAPFGSYLPKDHTLLSVDLPHHGNSAWPADKQWEVKELTTMVHSLMKEYGVKKISLLGYSMGGRVCLKIAELMPEYIDRILLVASDGLAFNPFYYFVTRTYVGKKIFKSFLAKPQRYMPLVNLARKGKVLHESRYKFAMQYLQTEQARDFLLRAWPAMCRLIPNDAKLKAAIRKHHIPVYVFMGNYDRIIPVKLAEKFGKELKTVQLHILEKGHRLMDHETLPQMAACLLA